MTPGQRASHTSGTGSQLNYGGAPGDSVEAAVFSAAKTRIGAPCGLAGASSMWRAGPRNFATSVSAARP